MRRRGVVAGAMGGGAAVVAAALPAAAAAAQDLPELRWRLVSAFPKSLETLFGGAEELCRLVGELSGGRFTITPFAAGEIVPGLQVLDAAQSGTVEMAHTPSYYFVGKSPAFSLSSALPFGLNYRLQEAWLHQGGGLAASNAFWGKFNVHGLPCGNTGVQMGGWFRKEINSLADLQGLKMRIAGWGGVIIGKLGVIPQQIAAADIYPALEKGTVDAVEFVGPHDDEKLGFAKVAKYYYYPGWWESAPSIFAYINLERWAALPLAYQRMLETAAALAQARMVARYDILNPQALRRLLAGGTQLRAFPAEIMQAAYEAANQFYAETAAADADFKAIYDTWLPVWTDGYLWWQVADLTMDSFMVRARSQSAPKG